MALILTLPADKKVYFASDFHLGTPNPQASRQREQKLIRWLDMAARDAAAIFLLGDIFDFWFEYRRVVPKGFVRFQGKLAQLADSGIKLYLFTGNHDMWMYDYFPEEFGIAVYHDPVDLSINQHKFLVGHGDGLGPGDSKYKMLKKIFGNRLSQRLFAMLHPSIGVGMAHRWSQRSRLANTNHEEVFHGDKEHLLVYCRDQEAQQHRDYYIFGHRHLVLDLEVAANSRYLNPGDWVTGANYIAFDGHECKLTAFTG